MTDQADMANEGTIQKRDESQFWHFPDFVTPKKEEVTEINLVFDDQRMKGTGKELIMEGLYIWYGQFHVMSDKPLLVHSAGSHVQMNFSLQSTTTYFPEDSSKPFVKFKPQQHNLFLLPERNMLVRWKPQEDAEVFSINLSTEFFFQNLPETHPLFQHFQKGIRQLSPAFMSWRNLPVTSRMISSLFEILNCSYTGYLKSLFVKAKVIELMALQFEQYEQLAVPDITSMRTDSDTEKMYLARTILMESMEKSWSLKSLAHMVGTNEFSLKKYFKEVFGKTVFGYLHDLRMEKSMQMLKEPGSRISEISQKTGYRHPTHFTAAFKKYYGILPNKVRIGMLHLAHFLDFVLESFVELADGGYLLDFV